MKIGIDLDNVLNQFIPAMIEFHNKTYGTNQKIEDYTSPNFEIVWGKTLKEALEKLDVFHKTPYFIKMKPLKDAQKIVGKLKDKNELFIITARTDDMKKDTENWVEENFPNTFSKIYYTNEFSQNGTSTTKKKVCDNINIDVLIEDNLQNVLDCTRSNRRAYLFDYPWNQCDKLPDNVKRVHSWKEIGNSF